MKNRVKDPEGYIVPVPFKLFVATLNDSRIQLRENADLRLRGF